MRTSWHFARTALHRTRFVARINDQNYNHADFMLSCGIGGLLGLWARWSLAFNRADSAFIPSRIYRNWVIGAVVLATLMILADAALQWRSVSPFIACDHIGNIAYLLGSYGAAAIAGIVVALVSRRGLSRAIQDDRNFFTDRRSAATYPDD